MTIIKDLAKQSIYWWCNADGSINAPGTAADEAGVPCDLPAEQYFLYDVCWKETEIADTHVVTLNHRPGIMIVWQLNSAEYSALNLLALLQKDADPQYEWFFNMDEERGLLEICIFMSAQDVRAKINSREGFHLQKIIDANNIYDAYDEPWDVYRRIRKVYEDIQAHGYSFFTMEDANEVAEKNWKLMAVFENCTALGYYHLLHTEPISEFLVDDDIAEKVGKKLSRTRSFRVLSSGHIAMLQSCTKRK